MLKSARWKRVTAWHCSGVESLWWNELMKRKAVVIMGKGRALKIPLKDIVLSQRNLRWEYGITS